MIKKILSNKRAAASYAIISFYRIMMIIIVCLVFVAVLWMQYSRPYDIRKLENAQIAKKVILCMTNESLVLTPANFNEKTLNDCMKTDNNVFINLTFQGKSIVSGRQELGVYCQVQTSVTGPYLPSCLKEDYSVLNSIHQEDHINVFIALDKNSKNVQVIFNK